MKRIKNIFFIFFCLNHFYLSAQLKVGDQPTSTRKVVALDVQGSNGLQGLWLPRVSDTSVAGIRALNPPDRLVIYHPPSGKLLIRSNNSWVSYLSRAITTVSSSGQSVAGPAITFQTGAAVGTFNDFNIQANSLANTVTFNMPDATPVVRGVVSTGVQTYAGAKTFVNGVTVSGAAGPASSLFLGVNSLTAPAAVTNKYLSVNSNGNVTLNAVNVVTTSTISIKTFTRDLDGLPTNLNNNSVDRYTFTIPGANFSSSSTVIVTPLSPLRLGTRIDFCRVYDPNTIEMNMSTLNTSQPFTSGNTGTFNITIIEF